MTNNCPNCGFDLAAESLLRVRLNKAGADSLTFPEHYAGLFSDLESLVNLGYATRNKAGWYVPTNKGAN
jgi:hypothetical protein